MNILKLNDVPFRIKILGGFGIMCALLIVVGVVGYNGVASVNGKQKFARQAMDVALNINDIDILVAEFKDTGNQKLMDQIDENIDHAQSTLEQMKKAGGLSQEARSEIDELLNDVKVYDVETDRNFELGKQVNDSYDAMVKVAGDLMPKSEALSVDAQNEFLKTRLSVMKFRVEPTEEVAKSVQAAADSQLNAFKLANASAEVMSLAENYIKSSVAYRDHMAEFVKSNTLLDEMMVEMVGSADRSSNNFGGVSLLEAEGATAAETTAASTPVMIIIFSVGAIVLGVVMAFLFTSMIVTPIKSLLSNVEKVADGDLRIEVDAKNAGKDELGTMTKSFGNMVTNLRSIVSGVSANAQMISSAAQQLAASTQQVNAAIQQVSSAVQEIAAGGENLAKQAIQTTSNTKELTEEAGKGSKAAQVAGTKMESLASAVNQSASVVGTLGDKSQQIVKIVDTINNIASQTNLLALNAAIEAARAGEAGRGFAVVADEVRKLAEESQGATKEIETLISGIKQNTDEAVSTMDTGKKEVDESATVVNEALASLRVIGDKIKSIESAVESVSAVAQQSSASSQQMSSGVQQTSSSMQQVASAAQQLASTSEELMQLVNRFKTNETDTAGFVHQSPSIKPTHLYQPPVSQGSSKSHIPMHHAPKGNGAKPMLSPEDLNKIESTKIKEEQAAV